MAASVLSNSVTSAFPSNVTGGNEAVVTTQSEEPRSKDTFYTIDDLLRTRASGQTAPEPIVAYPSSGTDYVYYTPQQVSCHIESHFIIRAHD